MMRILIYITKYCVVLKVFDFPLLVFEASTANCLCIQDPLVEILYLKTDEPPHFCLSIALSVSSQSHSEQGCNSNIKRHHLPLLLNENEVDVRPFYR